MSFNGLLSIPTEERGQTRLWHRFHSRLAEVVVPLLQQADISLGCSAAGRQTWLARSSECRCLVPESATGCRMRRQRESISVGSHGRILGQVHLCYGPTAIDLPPAVREIVHGLVRVMELEESESSLLEELSTCWENLEALREINAGMSSLEEAPRLLDRVMSRVIGLDSGLQAILWLEQKGRLEPHVVQAEQSFDTRPANEGLIGRVISAGQGMIINGRDRLRVFCLEAPELANAECVLVTPVYTRQGLRGALEIWNELPCTCLDSRAMHVAEVLALQAAMVVENDRLHQAKLESQRLHQEIEIGSSIQEALLAGQVPPRLPLYDVGAASIPSQYVDGDFFDFYTHGSGTLDVVIADVMGKGIPAALVGAASKHELIRALTRCLPEHTNCPPPVREVLRVAHEELAPRLISIERFVTLSYARFDSVRKVLTLVDCGHTRTIHFSPRNGDLQLLSGVNTPFGIDPAEIFEEMEVPFEGGDVFLFYSDGATEARNSSGDMFGEDRLAALVREHSDQDATALVDQIRQHVKQFAGQDGLKDDLTCITVKIREAREK